MGNNKLIIAAEKFETFGEKLIVDAIDAVSADEYDIENIDKLFNLSMKSYANAVNLRSGLVQMELNELQLNSQKQILNKK